MFLKRTWTHFFNGRIVFHGVHVPHFLYPVYHWWAFGLVPSLCYCEQCHNKHTCSCVFIIEWFIILWVYIYSNGIAGSNGISISRSLRDCHTVFHNGWTNLHSHQQCKTVPISPASAVSRFFNDCILTGMRWYLNAVLVCISLMTSDHENFFLCLLASCMSSFVKYLFISFNSVHLIPQINYHCICWFVSYSSYECSGSK